MTTGSTCSSAFRAHVVLCTVGPEICSRKKPCSVSAKTNAPRSHRETNAGEGAPQRCGPILSYFRVPPEQVFSQNPPGNIHLRSPAFAQAFLAMDKSQPKTRGCRPGSGGAR